MDGVEYKFKVTRVTVESTHMTTRLAGKPLRKDIMRVAQDEAPNAQWEPVSVELVLSEIHQPKPKEDKQHGD